MNNNNLPEMNRHDHRDVQRQMNNNERVVLRPRRRYQLVGNNLENIQNPVSNLRTDDESNDSINDCGTISHSFECGVCPQTFKNEGEVERHRQQHNCEEADSRQNDEQERNSQNRDVNQPDDNEDHISDSDSSYDMFDSDSTPGSSPSDSSDLGDPTIYYECTLCGVQIPDDQREAHRNSHQNRGRRHRRN